MGIQECTQVYMVYTSGHGCASAYLYISKCISGIHNWCTLLYTGVHGYYRDVHQCMCMHECTLVHLSVHWGIWVYIAAYECIYIGDGFAWMEMGVHVCINDHEWRMNVCMNGDGYTCVRECVHEWRMKNECVHEWRWMENECVHEWRWVYMCVQWCTLVCTNDHKCMLVYMHDASSCYCYYLLFHIGTGGCAQKAKRGTILVVCMCAWASDCIIKTAFPEHRIIKSIQ